MRRILAVGVAGLLAFTVTATPLSAADLGMPVKAPPITAPPPPEVDYTWLIAALIIGGITACVLECGGQHCQSPGAC